MEEEKEEDNKEDENKEKETRRRIKRRTRRRRTRRRTRRRSREPVPVELELWVQVLKGSARANRSGNRREVSGVCSPSISFPGRVSESGGEGE